MESSPFKALLVEGTSGVGKSALIDALIRRHAENSPIRKIRTFVHLAQSHTYGPLAVAEDQRTLTPAENIRHLDRILGMLEWFEAGVRRHSQAWCFVLIDTLHITHCVRPGVVRWADVSDIDERLAAIGCKLLFLEASPADIWKQGIEPRRDTQFLREYARKFGSCEHEIHQYFVDEQRTIADLFSRSTMPKCQFGASQDTTGLVNMAYQLWNDSSS